MSNNFIEEKKFKKISSKKLKTLTNEEKLIYYKKLRDYYLSLPYDLTKYKQDEENFKKAGKIIMPIFNAIFRPKIINNNLIPEKTDGKGLIYVSNHLGSLDQFTIISALGREKPIHILASDTLLKLKRGKLYKYVGCVFADKKSLKSQLKCLEIMKQIVLHGGDVLLFPEGTRNTENKFLLDFDDGAAVLARDTGGKIVPFAITEDYRPIKNNLYARIGNWMAFDENEEISDITEKIRDSIATLMWYNMDLEREKTIGKIEDKKKSLLKGKENQGRKKLQKKRDKLMKQRKKIEK